MSDESMNMLSMTRDTAMKASDVPVPTTVIEPSSGWSGLGLREIWQRRELLWMLISREIQATHRQTALGLSWIFLRPVIHMALLSVVFGRVVRVPSDGIPYPLFALAALLPWTFFSNAVTKGARSLVDNLHIISKVYFPRLMIPVAGTASGLVDFLASALVLLVVMAYYGAPMRVEMLAIPALLVMTFMFALAVSLWLATLSVRYRDVSFAVGFILQGLMFLSPVIYPVSLVPAGARIIYELNPLATIIQGYRWALLGTALPAMPALVAASLFVFVLLILGAYVFRRTERGIVDVL